MADDKPVKLSVELPGALYRELLAYAEVHAKATGLAEPLLPEKIAVPMIERFMRPIGASRPSGGGADGGGGGFTPTNTGALRTDEPNLPRGGA